MADILLHAQGGGEWGATLLIVDWGAILGSLAFLAAGLASFYAARRLTALVERAGPAGLMAGAGFALMFAAGSFLFGIMTLASGTLPTPNGESFVGITAYLGGCGFLALGVFLALTTWRNLRSARPALARTGRGGYGRAKAA